jgi:hypothetical protein
VDKTATTKDEGAKIQERSEALETIERDDLKKLLKEPHGFRFIQRVLDNAKILNNCFTGNSWTYFNEGRKAQALDVFADILVVAEEVSPTIIQELFLNKEYRELKQLEEKEND